jgi:hypothetical protein
LRHSAQEKKEIINLTGLAPVRSAVKDLGGGAAFDEHAGLSGVHTYATAGFFEFQVGQHSGHRAHVDLEGSEPQATHRILRPLMNPSADIVKDALGMA